MENQFKGTLSKLTYNKLFEEPIFCEANDSFQNSYDISDVNGKQICSISYQSNKDLGIGLNNQKEAESYALLFTKVIPLLKNAQMHIDSLDLSNVEFFNKYGFNVSELSTRTRELIYESTNI